MMENIRDLSPLLDFPKDIVIISHRNPDGDAIGSSLALYHFLNHFGHTVRVIFPSEYPPNFSWMPDSEKIVIYDIDPGYSKMLVEKADLIFCLDFNGLDRIDKLGDLVDVSKALKVMIDHHLHPESFVDFMLSDSSASSTSELVYEFISMLGKKKYLDVLIGECIFTGILTDTGSFKYSTSARLYQIVGELVELGVDDKKLQDLIFNSLEVKHLKLLGHCLNNRMEILEEHKTGIIYLTKDDYTDYDIQRGDTEGIVNYLLKIKELQLAAFITEQPTIVKISLRSKDDFSVEEMAKKHFKGGGHKNAAGGYSFQNLDTTLKRFKRLLPYYIPITNS